MSERPRDYTDLQGLKQLIRNYAANYFEHLRNLLKTEPDYGYFDAKQEAPRAFAHAVESHFVYKFAVDVVIAMKTLQFLALFHVGYRHWVQKQFLKPNKKPIQSLEV